MTNMLANSRIILKDQEMRVASFENQLPSVCYFFVCGLDPSLRKSKHVTQSMILSRIIESHYALRVKT
jgi:hypothetical protein